MCEEPTVHALVLIHQNPKYKAFVDRLDALRDSTQAKIEALKAQAEVAEKEHEATRNAIFAEAEDAIVVDGLAPKGYDAKSWNMSFNDGVVSVFKADAEGLGRGVPKSLNKALKRLLVDEPDA